MHSVAVGGSYMGQDTEEGHPLSGSYIFFFGYNAYRRKCVWVHISSEDKETKQMDAYR